MYKNARIQVGLSIEKSAELLHIGTRTLFNYENYLSPIPADIALNMSKVYFKPTLAAKHCRNNCSIGQIYACDIDETSIAETALNIVAELNEAQSMVNDLISIARDNKVSVPELPQFKLIKGSLRRLIKAATELEYVPIEKENAPAYAEAR